MIGSKTFKITQLRVLVNQINNGEISFSRFVEILNEQADGKRKFDLDKALSEIENAMERWHHARDEDGETLQKINNIMLEAGKLEWFNGGCTNYVENNFTDTCNNCGKGKYFHK